MGHWLVYSGSGLAQIASRMSSNFPKPVFTVSVRNLVEFVLRRGDLAGGGDFVSSTRMLEGTWGHQRLQRARPSGYVMESFVSGQWETDSLSLLVRGRIDGVLDQGEELIIEEIKTVRAGWGGEADPLHWAQGKIYAHLYLLAQAGGARRKIEVQLTYLELDSDQVSCFREIFSAEQLAAFFEAAVAEYGEWLKKEESWRRLRDESIRSLRFPFPAERAGQRDLINAVAATLKKGARLFAEAPTGLGKTMAVLYPALGAIEAKIVERLLFLTAKTVGRTIAQQACQEMCRAGLRWRALTLTAREKVCVHQGCDLRQCPFSKGYYDRVRPAMREALELELLTKAALEAVAERHQVCPFELALDCAPWVELIIADYNHVFDPRAYLRRLFAEPGASAALLIDEAHNLADRAREMFSAALDGTQLHAVRSSLRGKAIACHRALGRVEENLQGPAEDESAEGVRVSRDLPEALVGSLRHFLKEAESWLARNEPSEFRAGLLDLYFKASAFVRTSESYDKRFVTLKENARNRSTVRLFCLDPSALLRQALDRAAASVFFSATLSPLPYFRAVLGGNEGDPILQLASPFPAENLRVRLCVEISTEFRARQFSHDAVAREAAQLVESAPGNYLVYFPSYEYLKEVHARFGKLCSARTHVQRPGMSEEERSAYLGQFRADNPETLVGFAVLGGIFGEGIDLVGDRLIGVVVVGVGLPQVCVERELIRKFYQETLGAGFEYAYQYPGLNRVLQAAGRVIRSESDKGVVLLIDRRFGEERYRRLLPTWWRIEEEG